MSKKLMQAQAMVDAAIFAKSHAPREGVILLNGSEIQPEPISWLWKNWLANNKFHILAGAPGQGKTTIALALGAIVTSGGCWPDGSFSDQGNILIWSGEDDPADTLLPRLIAAGADRERCYFISDTVADGKTRPFNPASDIEQLRETVEKIGGVSLLIVDPVVSAVSGDSHKNTEVRRDLQPLVDLACACQCAVLGISHFSKGGQGQDPTQRVVGSVAFSAVARVVLVAAKVKGNDGEDSRILARSKSNIGPDDGGFTYHLEQVEALPGIEASKLIWGAAVQGSARDLLAEHENEPRVELRNSAVEFLQDLLKEGPVPVKTLTAQAQASGHSWRTVCRAADELSLIKEKDGMRGGWYWKLPKVATKVPKVSSIGDWPSSHSSVDTCQPGEVEI